MSKNDHINMVPSPWYEAGPLRVQVKRVTAQPLQNTDATLIVQRAARECWARDTGIYFGPARTTVLLYVHAGACRMEYGKEVGAQVETASAAHLLAVPPGARYRFWVDAKRDLELSIANATGAVCDQWWTSIARSQPCLLGVRRRRDIERALDSFLQCAPMRCVHDQQAALHHFQAFLHLVAADQTSGVVARSRGDVHADRCHELIEEQFERYTCLAELAGALDLHPDYLTRAYRKRFEVSPAEHLRRRKMEQASVWLREGERTHAEIARALGFADAYSFSKCFKAYAGLSPRHWREQFRLGGTSKLVGN